MRRKKIAIIGAGSAACTTALHYYLYGKDIFDKITIYYDPSSPIERVGQGSTLLFADKLYNAFGLNWYNNNLIKATPKNGILYENWGKKVDEIYHNFPMAFQAIHSVPELLSKLLLECGLCNVVEKRIEDPEEEIDSDFIFDCRGKNNRDPEIYNQLISPLNHVILSRKNEVDLRMTHTRCVATPDGWTFVIPNSDSISYGYLFNKSITDIETAKNNFKELFDVEPDIDYHFDNYIAKNIFSGERTILNGNRLSFLEPLEATSISFYDWVARSSWDYIVDGVGKDECNNSVQKEMNRIQTFILWHYQNGSKYDTPFWEYAKSLPFNPDDEFLKILDTTRKKDLYFCRNEKENLYSQWTLNSFKVWEENIK